MQFDSHSMSELVQYERMGEFSVAGVQGSEVAADDVYCLSLPVLLCYLDLRRVAPRRVELCVR